MARAYDLLVRARAQTSQAQRELEGFSQKMQRTGARLRAVGQTMTLGITMPVALAAGGMVKLASDAEETANLLEVTFGRQTRQVTNALDDFSRATGESRFQLREVAGQFGPLFKGLELGAEKTADMAVQMAKLAVDAGSFLNMDTGEAMERLRSGLAGEAEPLRRLNVFINEAAVKEKAYAENIAKRGEELTEAQKVQARYLLILEDTADMQGDAERTSGSMARRMNRLRNTFRDLGTQLGQYLMPAAEKLSEWIQKALDWFGDLSPRMQKVVLAVVGIAAAIGPLLLLIGGMASGIGALASALSFLLSPVGLVIAALVGATVAIVALYRNNEEFRTWVHAKFIPALKAIWTWLRREIPRAIDWLKRKWDEVWPKLRPVLVKIGDIIWKIAKVYFPAWWAAVKTAWAVAKPILIGIWERFGKIITRIRGVIDWLGPKLRPAFDWLEEHALPKVEKVANAFKKVAGFLADVAEKSKLLKKAGSLLPMGGITSLLSIGGSGDRSLAVPSLTPRSVDDFTPFANRFGLIMTSGFRPGDDGWHGVDRARDYSNGYGPTPQMLAFARWMAGTFGPKLRELIYTPLGFGIKNGRPVPLDFWGDRINAMHNNHVHVAYARGGVVTRPHLGLVGEAGPEAIIPLGRSRQAQADRDRLMRQSGLAAGGTTINVYGITDPVEAASVVARKQRMMSPARSY